MKSLQLSFDYCVHSQKEIEGNRTYLYEEGETLLTLNISLNDNFNFQSWCKILYRSDSDGSNRTDSSVAVGLFTRPLLDSLTERFHNRCHAMTRPRPRDQAGAELGAG